MKPVEDKVQEIVFILSLWHGAIIHTVFMMGQMKVLKAVLLRMVTAIRNMVLILFCRQPMGWRRVLLRSLQQEAGQVQRLA